jgi:hypothetical protein
MAACGKPTKKNHISAASLNSYISRLQGLPHRDNLQGFPYRYNYPCQGIPVSEYLQGGLNRGGYLQVLLRRYFLTGLIIPVNLSLWGKTCRES